MLRHAALPCALRKIYYIAMPQILDAFVLVASDAKVQFFLRHMQEKEQLFLRVTKFSEIFKYSYIQVGQEGF